MKDGALADQSLHFAVKILSLVRRLQKGGEHIVSKQVGRSGTSIGANIREAQFGSSRADFISKMHIALKETNETGYWLELLQQTNEISKAEYAALMADCSSIRAMLVASIKTAKEKLEDEKKD